MDECDGGCYDEDYQDEDENETDEEGSDDDSLTIDPAIAPPPEPVMIADGSAEAGPETTTAETESHVTPPQLTRPRNLDGGGARYWATTDLDFGEEPSNDIQDRSWDCHHDFSTHKIKFAAALTAPTAEMECVKCWSVVHPEIIAPVGAIDDKRKIVPARQPRRRRGRYGTPRGMFRADATIGTATHLNSNVSLLSQSVPGQAPSPMVDVHFNERIIDTYGDIITSTPSQLSRRASFGENSLDQEKFAVPFAFRKELGTFDTTPLTFSLAHECTYCNIVVCEKCKDEALAAQEAADKEEEEEKQQKTNAEQPGNEDEQQVPDENEDSDSDDDNGGFAPPSLVD